MSNSKVVMKLRKEPETLMLLKISRNLVAHAITGIGDLKAIACRQASLDGSPDEVVEFWDLVDIKADNVIQSLQSVARTLKGEED